jgi:hypothetical protein
MMNAFRKTLIMTAILIVSAALGLAAFSAWANETGLPPDMVKITGQEDFVYVWTLGREGIGDEQDKLVAVAVNPDSPQYGKVVHSSFARFAITSAGAAAGIRSPGQPGDASEGATRAQALF